MMVGDTGAVAVSAFVDNIATVDVGTIFGHPLTDTESVDSTLSLLTALTAYDCNDAALVAM